MEKRTDLYRLLVGKPEGRDHLEDSGVGGGGGWCVVLICILEKWDGGAWTGSIWLRIGTGGGLL
jgi:hypothetical protein